MLAIQNIQENINKYRYLLLPFYFFLLPIGNAYIILELIVIFLFIFTITSITDELNNNLNRLISMNYGLFIIIFFLIWLPMLISLPDAINLERSAYKVITVLPLLFIGIYLIDSVHGVSAVNRIYRLLVIIAYIWSLDFLIFYFEIFGLNDPILWRWAFTIDGINVIPIYGQLSSVLLAPVLEGLRRASNTKINKVFSYLFALVFIITIFMSGNRNAILMAFVSFLGWSLFLFKQNEGFAKNIKRNLILFFLAISILSFTLIINIERPILELNNTNFTLKQIDKISSGRIALWDSAIQITKDNWFNGIGPRGFRYIYEQYRPDKLKYESVYKNGSTHPHFALLEIFMETGIIGLLSLFLIIYLLYEKFLYLEYEQRYSMFPWFLAFLVSVIPNFGKAFYSSFWLTFIFFLLIVCLSFAREELNLNRD